MNIITMAIVLIVQTLVAGQAYSGTTVAANLTSDDTFLAIDDSVFQELSGLSLSTCEARKHENNPVITNRQNGPDKLVCEIPWVLQKNGKFRMWYIAHDEGEWPNWYTCYAESDDGYRWDRPTLGIVNYRGSTNNNIVYRGFLLFPAIYRDDLESDPQRRYKTTVFGNITDQYFEAFEAKKRKRYGKSQPSLECFAYSPDGLRWTKDKSVVFPIHAKAEAPTLYRMHGKWFMAFQMSIGDYPQVEPWSRFVGIASSSDFTNWQLASEPGLYYDPKYEGFIQTHVSPGYQDYGNIIVALEGMFQNDYELVDQQTDLGIILTNDGYHWRQASPRQPLNFVIRRGNNGSWDHDFPVQGNMLNAGRKTLLYYSAKATGGNAVSGSMQIGLAELRLDGYGYLAPKIGWAGGHDKYTGSLISHPIMIKDSRQILYLNIKGAQHEGEVAKVELQNKNGDVIEGYTMDDCDNITEDSVGIPVTWSGQSSLASLARQEVRVKIILVGANPKHLHSARLTIPRLYAFYFDEPTLWLKAQQRIYLNRGLERIDYRDSLRNNVKGLSINSSKPIEVSAVDISPDQLKFRAEGTANVNISTSGLIRLQNPQQVIPAENETISFAIADSQEVTVKIKRR